MASSAYGRLQERKPHGIKLNAKIKVYRATVLTTLLYGAEAWTCYHRNVKMLDRPHAASQTLWVSNGRKDHEQDHEVLQRAKMDGIEAMLMRAHLR